MQMLNFLKKPKVSIKREYKTQIIDRIKQPNVKLISTFMILIDVLLVRIDKAINDVTFNTLK